MTVHDETVIDEDWLAAVLGDVGSAIDVPSDGPARVLAARGPAPLGRTVRPPRSESSGLSRRRRVVVTTALASIALLVVALVATSGGHTSSTTSTVAGSAATSPSPNTSFGGSVDSKQRSPLGQASASSGAAGAAGPVNSVDGGVSAPAAPPLAAAAVPAKIIKTGSVDLQVGRGKLSPAVDQLTSLAGGLGGYVADAKTVEGGGAPTGDLTLRVPSDQFETLLSRTRALGKPSAVSTSGQDVTAAYVDLDARIHALQDTRTQYLQILSKASAIGDILSVEQQLSALQTQIEQLQGQQKVLADQTAFATLAVHLTEPGSSLGSVPPPPRGLSKAWDHARHTFAHGVEAVIGASGGLLVFLICAGLLLLVVRLAWPVVRRRLV